MPFYAKRDLALNVIAKYQIELHKRKNDPQSTRNIHEIYKPKFEK